MRAMILVTRPAEQAGELRDHLLAYDVEPVVVPTVALDLETTKDELDQMLTRLDGAEWLVVTSANGAAALSSSLARDGHRLPESVQVAAVGPATAAVLRASGVAVDHVPDEYLTVAIAAGLGDVRGKRVVLARADLATAELRDALVARGAVVEETVAYRTVEGPATSRDSLHAALQLDLDGIAFTSASTVRGLTRLTSPMDRARARAMPAFCIGPVTAAEAAKSGFHIAVVASPHTAAGLADAIGAHFAGGVE